MLSYREARDGQLLEEGITEAGATASWIAAGTSYSVHGLPMLPIYIYYSMFGFQRVGDLIWAAADQRARGFLFGATAGRTTLGGEGLQHQDGSSLVMASMVPNCRAWDPCFAGEVAVIMDHAMRRMLDEQRDEFHYLTLMNENYEHPSLPRSSCGPAARHVPLASRRPSDRRTGAAAGQRHDPARGDGRGRSCWPRLGVSSEVFSVTSFSELARDARDVERGNRLNPGAIDRVSHVQRMLAGNAPVVAATDYVRAWPQLIAEYVDARYVTLGTDGFGRSDTRSALRSFFEVDRGHIVLAALQALVRDGAGDRGLLAEAAQRYGIRTDAACALAALSGTVGWAGRCVGPLRLTHLYRPETWVTPSAET
jgi:pyruvate dehydrogenase E1 component